MIMFPGANMWAINADNALYGGLSGPPDAGGSLSPLSECLAVTCTVVAHLDSGPYYGLLRIAAPLPGSYDMSGFSSLALDWASLYAGTPGTLSCVVRIIGTGGAGYSAVCTSGLPGAVWVTNYSFPISGFAPEGLTPVAETMKNVGEVEFNFYYYSGAQDDSGSLSVFMDNVRFKN